MSTSLSGICGLQVWWTVELWKVISWSEFSWIQALLCDKHIYVNVISWKVWPLSKPSLFWEKHCLRCSPAYCWSTWSTICFLSLPSSGNQCSENGNVEIYIKSTETLKLSDKGFVGSGKYLAPLWSAVQLYCIARPASQWICAKLAPWRQRAWRHCKQQQCCFWPWVQTQIVEEVFSNLTLDNDSRMRLSWSSSSLPSFPIWQRFWHLLRLLCTS